MARMFAPSVRAPRARTAPRRLAARRMPAALEPMLATLSQHLPENLNDYGFEYKWDGVRALCYWDGRTLRIESRNQLDITRRYPELHVLADALGSRTAILDGEIVALDENDRPSFPLLQNRMHVNDPASIRRLVNEVPVRYLVFDLLYLDGRSTMDRSYLHRRDLLEQLTLVGPSWQVPPAHVGEGAAMLQAAREQQLEGIVAKHVDSIYQPGRRSPDWLKIKVISRQEFVIGGWVPEGGNNTSRIGSLLLGYYEPADTGGRGEKTLRFAGGVGTGFNDRWHRTLSATLKPLTRAASPFVDPVPKREAIFVEPILVAEVEYRRWPAGGMVHQGAFKGLRADKDARKVVREDRACVAPTGGDQ
jgi:bifunctional non-homologous end joining protein LigD